MEGTCGTNGRGFAYHFFTGTRKRGGNVSVTVSSEDGSIIHAGITPL